MSTPVPDPAGTERRPHPEPPLGESGGAAFGEFLRRAREQRGLTLQQIASETKIPRRHLEALERGDLAAVPGGTYRRGEIRAYAQAVRMDQSLALAQLERALAADARKALADDAGPTHKRGRLRRQAPALIGLLAISWFLGRALWNGLSGRQEDRQRPSAIVLPSDDVGPAPAQPPAETQPSAPPPDPATAAPVNGAIAETAAPTPQDDIAPGASAVVGELVVVTDPPGARVTINGIAWGTTPVTVRHLPFGAKRIRLTKYGFAPEDRLLELSERRPRGTLEVSLRSTPEP